VAPGGPSESTSTMKGDPCSPDGRSRPGIMIRCPFSNCRRREPGRVSKRARYAAFGSGRGSIGQPRGSCSHGSASLGASADVALYRLFRRLTIRMKRAMVKLFLTLPVPGNGRIPQHRVYGGLEAQRRAQCKQRRGANGSERARRVPLPRSFPFVWPVGGREETTRADENHRAREGRARAGIQRRGVSDVSATIRHDCG
jgi:hypothetical protein